MLRVMGYLWIWICSASAGHLATVRLLLDDGANVHATNKHNNKPIDLALDPEVRALLHNHQTEPRAASRNEMHQALIQRYRETEDRLEDAVDAAKNAQQAFTLQEIEQITARLDEAIAAAQRVGMDERVIRQGKQYAKLLDVLRRLETQSDELAGCTPIKSQSLYEQHVVPLELIMKTAELLHVEPKHLHRAEALKQRAQAELRLELCIARLKVGEHRDEAAHCFRHDA